MRHERQLSAIADTQIRPRADFLEFTLSFANSIRPRADLLEITLSSADLAVPLQVRCLEATVYSKSDGVYCQSRAKVTDFIVL